MPEAILDQPLPETDDGVYNYARVLCHLAAIVTKFMDAWSEGDGSTFTQRETPSTVWNLFGCSVNLLPYPHTWHTSSHGVAVSILMEGLAKISPVTYTMNM